MLLEIVAPLLLWLVWLLLAWLGVKGYNHWYKTKMGLVSDIAWLILLATYTLVLSVLFLLCVEATI